MALAYIGTQGDKPGQGIVAVDLDTSSGVLKTLGTVAEEERPTWTLPDPNRPVLYSLNEVGNRDDRSGTITSFKIIDGSGALAPLSRQSTSGGPTHLALNDQANMLYCANFGGPHAVGLPVDQHGCLRGISASVKTQGSGPHRRQKVPHPHGVCIDPSGRYLLVPDMGADRIYIFVIDGEELRSSPQNYLQMPAGCGPRFVLFGKGGIDAYMVAELSGQVFHLRWDPKSGELSTEGFVNLDAADAEHEPGAAAFGLSRDGRFLFVSNRATNEICVFSVQAATGALAPVQVIGSGGEKPWGLCQSECGDWMLVANQASNAVVCFSVDQSTGKLTSTGQSLPVETPTSISFVPGRALDLL